MIFFSNVVWGTVLLTIGLVTLLNAIFNLHIPIFKIMLALFFVSLGIKILFGTRCGTYRSFSGECYSRGEGCCFFNHNTCGTRRNTKTIANGEYTKYAVVFGQKTIDLTEINIAEQDAYIEVEATFGEVIVKIDSRMPIAINARISFGSIVLPDATQLIFDKDTYKTPTYQNAEHKIELAINATFGSVRIVDINQK